MRACVPACLPFGMLACPACSAASKPSPPFLCMPAVTAGDVVVFRPGAVHGIDNGDSSRMYW